MEKKKSLFLKILIPVTMIVSGIVFIFIAGILSFSFVENFHQNDAEIKESTITNLQDDLEDTAYLEEPLNSSLETDVQESFTDTKYITIDLSQVEETHAEGAAVSPLRLTIESVENNGINFANEWYESENLSLPMIGDTWDHFYDESYEYQWIGDELDIYEKGTEKCLYVLQYPTDKWYVNGNNAYLKDGIFYGACVYNGYAQPNSCFLFAYDLNHEKLLWRSADQSYNTMNFLVKGDVIICGYGFTDEKDYLYQINRNTGEMIDRIELKKMPDLLVEQDGKLYVHTYSVNYTIKME